MQTTATTKPQIFLISSRQHIRYTQTISLSQRLLLQSNRAPKTYHRNFTQSHFFFFLSMSIWSSNKTVNTLNTCGVAPHKKNSTHSSVFLVLEKSNAANPNLGYLHKGTWHNHVLEQGVQTAQKYIGKNRKTHIATAFDCKVCLAFIFDDGSADSAAHFHLNHQNRPNKTNIFNPRTAEKCTLLTVAFDQLWFNVRDCTVQGCSSTKRVQALTTKMTRSKVLKNARLGIYG